MRVAARRCRVDPLSPAARSRLMSSVRSKNTAPERLVRSVLHRLGYRFRLHRADLPGKPDIVLVARRQVVFVNGCFWHQHPGCPAAATPRTNRKFWREKLRGNVKRLDRQLEELRVGGWSPFVLWECEISTAAKALRALERLGFENIMGKRPSAYTVVDLFSGAGGMSYGFKAHPAFKPVFAVDAEKGKPSSGAGRLECNSTYEANIGVKVRTADLASFSPKELASEAGIRSGELDVLISCAPCTGFSRPCARIT